VLQNVFLFFWEGVPDFSRPEGELLAFCWEVTIMVYETIKLYSEKFTTNNSENKQELSYTPKLANNPTAPEPIASVLDSDTFQKIINPPQIK
jgi:hypothetical protein